MPSVSSGGAPAAASSAPSSGSSNLPAASAAGLPQASSASADIAVTKTVLIITETFLLLDGGWANYDISGKARPVANQRAARIGRSVQSRTVTDRYAVDQNIERFSEAIAEFEELVSRTGRGFAGSSSIQSAIIDLKKWLEEKKKAEQLKAALAQSLINKTASSINSGVQETLLAHVNSIALDNPQDAVIALNTIMDQLSGELGFSQVQEKPAPSVDLETEQFSAETVILAEDNSQFRDLQSRKDLLSAALEDLQIQQITAAVHEPVFKLEAETFGHTRGFAEIVARAQSADLSDVSSINHQAVRIPQGDTVTISFQEEVGPIASGNSISDSPHVQTEQPDSILTMTIPVSEVVDLSQSQFNRQEHEAVSLNVENPLAGYQDLDSSQSQQLSDKAIPVRSVNSGVTLDPPSNNISLLNENAAQAELEARKKEIDRLLSEIVKERPHPVTDKADLNERDLRKKLKAA